MLEHRVLLYNALTLDSFPTPQRPFCSPLTPLILNPGHNGSPRIWRSGTGKANLSDVASELGGQGFRGFKIFLSSGASSVAVGSVNGVEGIGCDDQCVTSMSRIVIALGSVTFAPLIGLVTSLPVLSLSVIPFIAVSTVLASVTLLHR